MEANKRQLRLINNKLETICFLDIVDTVVDNKMNVMGIVNTITFDLLKNGGVKEFLDYIETEYGYVWNAIKSPRLPYQSVLESLRLEYELINRDKTKPDNIIMLFSK